MPNCHEMKVGDIYTCEECMLELLVINECKDSEVLPDDCQCEPCSFVCCGEELKKKQIHVVVYSTPA